MLFTLLLTVHYQLCTGKSRNGRYHAQQRKNLCSGGCGAYHSYRSYIICNKIRQKNKQTGKRKIICITG